MVSLTDIVQLWILISLLHTAESYQASSRPPPTCPSIAWRWAATPSLLAGI